MALNWILILGGAFALVVLVIIGVGFFFFMRRVKRMVDNMLYFKRITQDHVDLINNFIEGKEDEFKKAILLLNIFSEDEIRRLVYAFNRMKQDNWKNKIKEEKLKGGKKSLWQKMMRK